MCKHIRNAQVSIRSQCCRQWFDCSQCHSEQTDHKLRKTFELVFACKACKKVFRKDSRDLDETDEYCPHCDNHYVVPAELPESQMEQIMINNESEDQRDEYGDKIEVKEKMVLDPRMIKDTVEDMLKELEMELDD
ncbi:hypothetical protein CONCODRAFT_87117 [Conidiobolus coronatus NRRL 28638]|uniref:CHY-type domain-containing protein n=1 Tax=Conidiobolus coronatus (strain ATCC 28846 / CBS 209.66 / NRRL 28638) TaxID=796925 RepID=A0A137NWP1_CONC2|nr:hypothetical protein CONCODRAFT_87117 [Conidiobolus coronatus NRRL 28638]|eukprot:KXN67177.1 hypothetical protein CONCODRAFT_87117 [Conidiobolus coronatus NRRL 28638]